MKDENPSAELVEAICTEKCAQMGDPPCSRVSSDPHCDECLGVAMAALNWFNSAERNRHEG